jgi:hypothetical protein
MASTSPTSLGCEISKRLTDSLIPSSEWLSNSSFRFPRVASCTEVSVLVITVTAVFALPKPLAGFIYSAFFIDFRVP